MTILSKLLKMFLLLFFQKMTDNFSAKMFFNLKLRSFLCNNQISTFLKEKLT